MLDGSFDRERDLSVLKRVLWSGLCWVLLAAAACGSDDGKKRSQSDADAGAGGEDVGAGGSAAGAPQGGTGGDVEPTEGGTGGVAEGGVGGIPNGDGGDGGDGGEPSRPEPELLFSVKRGALGLPDTAIRALSEDGKEGTVIYTSSSGSQEGPDGTNAVKVTGEQLGLAETTQIVAFAEAQPEPASPLYLFSVAPGSTGAQPTQLYDRYQLHGDAYAHLFFSDGVPSYRSESNIEGGYNGILAINRSLGLGQEDEVGDDLVGLVSRDARQPLTELYFTVGTNAEGAEGSPLSELDPYEVGCTVFKSALDGTHEVAFTCEELGLAGGFGDRIDGLAVLTAGAQLKLVFSVSSGSLGLEGSAVEAKAIAGGSVGATLFSSVGDGTNAVHLQPDDLGLADNSDEEIDGITVIDAPQPTVESVGSCELDLYPVGDDLLSYMAGAAYLGTSTLLLFGPTSGGEDARVLAYDLSTCEHVQTKDLSGTPLQSPLPVATVKLAGWSADSPLDAVAYYKLGSSNGNKALERYSATGELESSVPILDMLSYEDAIALVYDAAHDSFFVLTYYASDAFTLWSFPRPAGGATEIEAVISGMDLPCATAGALTGVDAQGNLYVGEAGNLNRYRVCAVSPAGLLRPSPYFWPAESYGVGLVVPGGAHYVFNYGGAPSIERGAYQK